VQITAPEMPGEYELRVDLPDPFSDITEEVTVHPPADQRYDDLPPGEDVDLALETVAVDRHGTGDGDVLGVGTTWYVIDSPEIDLSGTAQLFNQNGDLVAQTDTLIESASGRTSSWHSGARIVTNLSLAIPDDLEPGDYRILIALYDAADPDLPRATLLLPDGSTATEHWIEDIQISPD
ncbi:MAG: hypothetical protein ACOC9Y_09265, partial [Chloroflexota bacterium]